MKEFYFELFFRIRVSEKLVEIFHKENFYIKYFYNTITIGKSFNNLDGLEFSYNTSSTISDGSGYISGTKADILDFLILFLRFVNNENILERPMRIYFNENQTMWIDLEKEEDIYGIFDENSPKIKKYYNSTDSDNN